MERAMQQTQQVLREVVQRHPPSAFYNCGDFFRTLHKQIKGEIKQYSYRQLSVDLGFSPTNLVHLIVQGKRPVTEKAAHKISEALDLKRDERRYFLSLAQLTREKEPSSAAKTFSEALDIRQGMIAAKLSEEEQAYFSEWYHPIVREMILLDKFQEDAAWIAQHINPSITPEQAKESLDLLIRLGLISRDPDTGRLIQRERTISSGASIQDAIKNEFHKVSIKQGLAALENMSPDQRNVSTMVLSLSKGQLERVRQEIRVFQQKLLEIEHARGDTAPECVVRLNLQLFPSCSF